MLGSICPDVLEILFSFLALLVYRFSVVSGLLGSSLSSPSVSLPSASATLKKPRALRFRQYGGGMVDNQLDMFELTVKFEVVNAGSASVSGRNRRLSSSLPKKQQKEIYQRIAPKTNSVLE